MKEKINLVIVSGVYGAGKTYTLSCFEENGYKIIENIPLSLIKNLCKEFLSNPLKYKKVALSIVLEDAKEAYLIIKEFKDIDLTFIGLDCSKEVLLERYKLSRKVHPYQITKTISLNDSIDLDKQKMESIRNLCTHYIDTSKFSIGDLRKLYLNSIFNPMDTKMVVNFVSFGYKKSVPQDVETVFDVRILPNPFWIKELKELSGLDKEVKDYIMSFDITKEYLKHLTSYLDYYLKHVNESGRKMITIGIACSGGQHRSVMVAEYLKNYYGKVYNTYSMHRDLIK